MTEIEKRLGVSHALVRLMNLRAQGLHESEKLLWDIKYQVKNKDGHIVVDKILDTKKKMTKYKAVKGFVKYLRDNSKRLRYKEKGNTKTFSITERRCTLFEYTQF